MENCGEGQVLLLRSESSLPAETRAPVRVPGFRAHQALDDRAESGRAVLGVAREVLEASQLDQLLDLLR